MYKQKKILALIPARGGSKGIADKNICDLAGKPLIGWAIDAAKKSQYIDRLILSSDSEKIMTVAQELGCDVPFTRPSEFATDDAPGIAPVIHAAEQLPEYEYLVLLQPTSPLRNTEDIDRSIETCIDTKALSCVSVQQAKPPSWYYKISDSGQLLNENKTDPTREKREHLYRLNGAVYVVKISALLEQRKMIFQNQTMAYAMPEERSVDIDTPFEMDLARTMLLAQQTSTD